MKNSGFQVLKLRASYGETGNERIEAGTEWTGLQPPRTRDTYANSAGVGGQYNGVASYNINFGVNDLQWETTTQLNVGIDFEFFKNRARGTIDYYNRLTRDLFYLNPSSALSGVITLTKNTEIEVTNEGLELTLAYDLVRNDNFKFTELKNLVCGELRDEQILIWATFIDEIILIQKLFEGSEVIYGKISISERERKLKDFQQRTSIYTCPFFQDS
jgi:hypothetical protein